MSNIRMDVVGAAMGGTFCNKAVPVFRVDLYDGMANRNN